jgi:serine/threonine protein kinase/DNA-directed RNA polymerase subunit RPC12/RpoP
MVLARKQVVQRCPNCSAKYDVGIYVSGQKVRCRRCGIKFAVVRNDTQYGQDLERGKIKPVGGAPGGNESQRPPRPATKQHRTAQNDIALGTMLAGYEVGTVLGRGAMGTVYRAKQISLDRPVALKLMSSDLVSQPEFILRFKREAAALAALAHHNVVSIIDQGNVENNWYFVMEYVDGPTLRRMLSQRSLRLSQALDLAVQIGRGLDYAHGKGVVHRDLKPENVLLADGGPEGHIAKICDFGLADILYSDRSYVNLTGSRISMGTVNYMAPEQRQDAGRVDQRADVYSYGVLLYEMFTGELPLGRFAEPSKKNKALDRRVDPVLMRALEPDARRRYPRVREIVDVLEAVKR